MRIEDSDREIEDSEQIEPSEIIQIRDGVMGNIYATFGFLPKLEDGNHILGSNLADRESVIAALMSNDTVSVSTEGYSQLVSELALEDLYRGFMKMTQSILERHYKANNIATEILGRVNYNYLELRDTNNGAIMLLEIGIENNGNSADILLIGPDKNIVAKISAGKVIKN